MVYGKDFQYTSTMVKVDTPFRTAVLTQVIVSRNSLGTPRRVGSRRVISGTRARFL